MWDDHRFISDAIAVSIASNLFFRRDQTWFSYSKHPYQRLLESADNPIGPAERPLFVNVRFTPKADHLP